jgi:hypothetical protein
MLLIKAICFATSTDALFRTISGFALVDHLDAAEADPTLLWHLVGQLGCEIQLLPDLPWSSAWKPPLGHCQRIDTED